MLSADGFRNTGEHAERIAAACVPLEIDLNRVGSIVSVFRQSQKEDRK